jgi:hypothetical protein
VVTLRPHLGRYRFTVQLRHKFPYVEAIGIRSEYIEYFDAAHVAHLRALRIELSAGEKSAFLMLRISFTGNLKQTTKQSSSKPSSKTQANNQAKLPSTACHPKAPSPLA